jgi:hypothetical protein
MTPIRMSVGMAKNKTTKTIKIADLKGLDAIEVTLELGNGSYGATVGYVEIVGKKAR